MHIVYLHQYFVTNAGSSGTRSYDMARQLVARGHRVSLITGMLDHSELRCRPGQLWEKLEVDGIDVYVVNVDYGSGGAPVRRVASWLAYASLATLLVQVLDAPDVVFASSTPPTVALPALGARLLRGVPFVYELRDLWPESLIWVGLDEDSPAVGAMRLFNKLSFAAAATVTTITPGFLPALMRTYGLPHGSVPVVPLGADPALYTPSGATLRGGRIGSGDLLAVYAGAFGRVNHLDYLLDAAALLRDRDDIKLLLIGGGKLHEAIAARVERESLDNVIVRGPMAKVELAGALATADVGINCVIEGNQNRVALPNKCFDYFSAGLPILTTAEHDGGGVLAKLVADERCGAGVSAREPAAAAEVLRRWADDRQELEAMRARARNLAEARYDRRQLAADLETILQRAVG